MLNKRGFIIRIPASPVTVIAIVFALSQLLVQSYLATLLGEPISRLALAATAVCVIAGLAFAMMQRNWRVLLLFTVMMLLFLLQTYVFSTNFGARTNYNALLQYIPALSFAIFANRSFQPKPFFKTLLLASLAYCLIYIGFYDNLLSAAETSGTKLIPVLSADGVRAARLYLAGVFPAFVLMYSVARLRNRFRAIWLIPAVIALATIFAAQGRTFIVMNLLVVVLFLSGLATMRIRIGLAVVFVAITISIVWGVWLPGANFFELFASDDSGAARMISYGIVSELVDKHWFFGVGIAPNRDWTNLIIGSPYLYWQDLGPLGIWYTFGLFGLVLYVFQATRCLLGMSRLSGWTDPQIQTVSLLGLLAGLSSLLSPGIWTGEMALVLGMVLGLTMRARTERFVARSVVSSTAFNQMQFRVPVRGRGMRSHAQPLAPYFHARTARPDTNP